MTIGSASSAMSSMSDSDTSDTEQIAPQTPKQRRLVIAQEGALWWGEGGGCWGVIGNHHHRVCPQEKRAEQAEFREESAERVEEEES